MSSITMRTANGSLFQVTPTGAEQVGTSKPAEFKSARLSDFSSSEIASANTFLSP